MGVERTGQIGSADWIEDQQLAEMLRLPVGLLRQWSKAQELPRRTVLAADGTETVYFRSDALCGWAAKHRLRFYLGATPTRRRKTRQPFMTPGVLRSPDTETVPLAATAQVWAQFEAATPQRRDKLISAGDVVEVPTGTNVERTSGLFDVRVRIIGGPSDGQEGFTSPRYLR